MRYGRNCRPVAALMLRYSVTSIRTACDGHRRPKAVTGTTGFRGQEDENGKYTYRIAWTALLPQPYNAKHIDGLLWSLFLSEQALRLLANGKARSTRCSMRNMDLDDDLHRC